VKRAIIIGAGYGGMALANLLGKAGYSVDVFEKNAAAGGRISAVEQDGYVFDLGPSWYLMPEVFEQYYNLFGESADRHLELLRFSPGYKVYFDNHEPVLVQGDVNKDKQTFESIEAGAGEKLERYVAHSSLVYDVSVRRFLYNNYLSIRDLFHPSVLRHVPRMLRLVTQHLDHYVSAQFQDLRLRQLLEYHMVFLGSSPFQAPAIYSLMSHLDFRSGVYYPKRGMLSLAEDMQKLGERYDITYHFDTPVDAICTKQGKAIGIRLADGTEHFADEIISNADLQFTETRLVPEQYRSFSERYWQKRQPGPGALLVSLGVEGELPTLQHHNLYFVHDWRENFEAIYETKTIPKHASLYVCNPTKTDPSLAPAGHENLFFLVPIPSGVELSSREQERIAEAAVRAFADVAQIPDLPERIRTRLIFGPHDFEQKFNAWQYNAFGGESHILAQSVLFRTPNKSRKLDNLYYVGAGTVPGIGLPMCLISAQLAFKRITRNRASGPLTESEV